MSDTVLFIDDLRSSFSSISICRICHEEELESCKGLESPCACSGTAKFAHRDCIQRWCDEKGNTVCEICLQKFEPGYTSSPPKTTPLPDITVTIRESSEVSRIGTEEENSEEIREREEYLECELAAERSASKCKSVALIFTALLMIRHLFDVLIYGGSEGYPFSFLTVVIVKASGIILPMYIIIRITGAIHNNIRHHYSNPNSSMWSYDDEDDYDEEQADNESTERNRHLT